MMDAGSDIVGSGIAFPLRVDAQGRLALAGHEADVEEAIRIIIGTAPGERPMRPEFGCGIHAHVFDAIEAATIGQIGLEVRRALERWEPRIDVLDVTFDLGGAAAGRLGIEIAYRLRATNSLRNLVYPFYLIPDEDER